MNLPAACGAFVPTLIVHARHSSSPAVKKVIRPNNLKAALINLLRPDSSSPKSDKNSFASSSSSSAISDSTLAEITTTPAFSF